MTDAFTPTMPPFGGTAVQPPAAPTLAPPPVAPPPPALDPTAVLAAAATDLLSPAGEANIAAARHGDLMPLAAELISDTKPFWQSKTLIALGVSSLGAVWSHFGHPVSAADQASLVSQIATAAPLVLEYGGMTAAALFRVIGTAKLA
jgi:hypothetical protein